MPGHRSGLALAGGSAARRAGLGLFARPAQHAAGVAPAAPPTRAALPAAAALARYRYRSPVLGMAAHRTPARALSSYDVEQSAMQDLLREGPHPTSNLPTDTLVFVLATAQQVAAQRHTRAHTRMPRGGVRPVLPLPSLAETPAPPRAVCAGRGRVPRAAVNALPRHKTLHNHSAVGPDARARGHGPGGRARPD